MQWLTDQYNKIKGAVTGSVQTPISQTVESAGLSSVATDNGATQTLGTAPETPGTTMTGGKKARKTRRARKSKKTRRH